ncbi:MAG: hypothetical protein M5R36_16485 [Deltaproteobacteria bacterium]|nr:hypothetical protein [Deltaproteobacteria bacterium]
MKEEIRGARAVSIIRIPHWAIIVLLRFCFWPRRRWRRKSRAAATRGRAPPKPRKPRNRPRRGRRGGALFFASRGGGGSSSATIAFDDTPFGYDDEVEMTGLGTVASELGVEAWFFPTKGRHMLLSAGLLSFGGVMVLDLPEDEPGHDVLDERAAGFRMTALSGGIGYRFLFGNENEMAATVQARLGLGGGFLTIDEIDTWEAGGGFFDLSGGAHYRFANRVIFGGQMDLRFWSMTAPDVDALDARTVDVSFAGSALLLSALLGYEFE